MSERVAVSAERIFVAGHKGLVGSALLRCWQRNSVDTVLTADRAELDLRDGAAVRSWFEEQRPTRVILAAARVGGIHANSHFPAEFIHDNLVIQTNVIDAAWRYGVRKLLFLGSSCIYPKFAPQPMREEYLLTGALEPTNEWYAVAKIAGIKLCQAYRRQYGFDAICAMPTNLYGPGDNFHPENSHVLPALVRRFHEAHARGDEAVTMWGTGTPRREFLHVDDLADACRYLLDHYSEEEIINVGVGTDVSILELAQLIAHTVGFSGEILTDPTKPDGTPRKLLDVSRLATRGWRAQISLEEGVASTYRWFLEHQGETRG